MWIKYKLYSRVHKTDYMMTEWSFFLMSLFYVSLTPECKSLVNQIPQRIRHIPHVWYKNKLISSNLVSSTVCLNYVISSSHKSCSFRFPALQLNTNMTLEKQVKWMHLYFMPLQFIRKNRLLQPLFKIKASL